MFGLPLSTFLIVVLVPLVIAILLALWGFKSRP